MADDDSIVPKPATLRGAGVMLLVGLGCLALAVGLNTWAGWGSWIGMMSMLVFGMNGLWLTAWGLYFCVVLGHSTVPETWQGLYSVAVILGVWCACLAIFTDGASFGRMTLSGWGAVWRGVCCVGIFHMARHMTTEMAASPKFKAYMWAVVVVAAVMWLGEQGVFSGPSDDDPYDDSDPLPPDQANDQALFNYVTYSLVALVGVSRAGEKTGNAI